MVQTRFKYQQVLRERTKATPRKDEVDFSDIIANRQKKDFRSRRTKKTGRVVRGNPQVCTGGKSGDARQGPLKRRRCSEISGGPTLRKKPAAAQRKQKIREPTLSQITKQVIRAELRHFIGVETCPHTNTFVQGVVREFAINVCGDEGILGKQPSLKDAEEMARRSNPKNEHLRRRLAIMEGQLQSYEAEEQVWADLTRRLEQEHADAMTRASSPVSAPGATVDVSRDEAALENTLAQRDEQLLGAAQAALVQADVLQHMLSSAEQSLGGALSAKKKLACGFASRVHSSLGQGKTPRKLIRGLLR